MMHNEFKSNLTINGIPLEKSFIFSGGELQIRLPETFVKGSYIRSSGITIKTILNSANAIMELILTKKALDHYCPDEKVELICWYLPYMRQDRICHPGECNSSVELLNILESLEFNIIYTADLHSKKPFEHWGKMKEKLYNNFKIPMTRVVEFDSFDIITKTLNNLDNFNLFYDVLVAPDKGAVEKVAKIAEHFNLPYIIGDKIRDPENGQIIDYHLDLNGVDTLRGKTLLVIDDIVDGGGTFILLGDKLKRNGARNIDLYVTHGIFSKGVMPLYNAGYDLIITTDSLMTDNNYKKVYTDSFKILNLSEILQI